MSHPYVGYWHNNHSNPQFDCIICSIRLYFRNNTYANYSVWPQIYEMDDSCLTKCLLLKGLRVERFILYNLIMPMDKVSISILDIGIIDLKAQLSILKSLGIRRLHLDVLDTSFVHNISFGPSIVNQITQLEFIFDVHIMVNHPIIILKQLNLAKIDLVCIHWEAEGRDDALAYLKDKTCKVGIAINPDTPINEIVFKDIDLILVMSVYPGFGGQLFINNTVERIRTLRDRVRIGVDGGINLDNVALVRDCDLIVIGSAFTKSTSKEDFLRKLCEILN